MHHPQRLKGISYFLPPLLDDRTWNIEASFESHICEIVLEDPSTYTCHSVSSYTLKWRE